MGDLDGSDGTIMGKMLMEHTSKLLNVKERGEKSRSEKLERFFSEFQSMKALKKECMWFEPLMEAIIVNNSEVQQLAKLNNQTSDSQDRYLKLSLLEKSDGYSMGSNFLYQLSRAATEDGAVSSWCSKYPALREFAEDHSFFKPLMSNIGKSVNTQEVSESLPSE